MPIPEWRRHDDKAPYDGLVVRWCVTLALAAVVSLLAAALLAPYPSEQMTCWSLSARVGNVKNKTRV
jgi:hypothetical protein